MTPTVPTSGHWHQERDTPHYPFTLKAVHRLPNVSPMLNQRPAAAQASPRAMTRPRTGCVSSTTPRGALTERASSASPRQRARVPAQAGLPTKTASHGAEAELNPCVQVQSHPHNVLYEADLAMLMGEFGSYGHIPPSEIPHRWQVPQ